MARRGLSLTDDEGVFMALLVRIAPATAYAVTKVYANSPVSNFGTSKGKIYPLIRRLRAQGLIRARPVENDQRGSELLECTAAGIEAVRKWAKEMRPGHLLVEDPLRTKVQSFDLLTRTEQLEWIENATTGLTEKLEALRSYGEEVDVPFHAFVHENAVCSIQYRLDWLRRLASHIARSPQ